MSSPKKTFDKGMVQKLVAGIIGMAALLFVSCQFVLAPLGEDKQRLEGEIAKERTLLAENEKLKGMADRVSEEYNTAAQSLKDLMSRQMPPYDNAMAWATDYLGSVAEAVPDLVLGGKQAEPAMASPSDTGVEPLFEEYVIRTEVMGSFHDVGRFVAALEKANPAMRIGEISIVGVVGGSAPPVPGAMVSAPRLSASLRMIFLRFNKNSFKPEERPDAASPRRAPAKAAAGAKAGGG
jgi:hypothetical protein